jgi:hypothetical protein
VQPFFATLLKSAQTLRDCVASGGSYGVLPRCLHRLGPLKNYGPAARFGAIRSDLQLSVELFSIGLSSEF